jgi:uncharacterized membrane protein
VPVVTVVCGGLLIALGLWGKYGTGTPSNTALIPAGVGAVLVVLGVLALKESLLKHAMHAAAALGLLGFLAGAARFVQKWAHDGKVEGPAALSTGLMALICAAFVALCVNSFVAARRRRKAAQAQGGAGL